MMGYRSVVEAVFYTRKEEELPMLKLYVESNFPNQDWLRECLRPTLNVAKAPNRAGCWGYHFICDNVKWYDSYDSVREYADFVSKFMEFADSNEGVWAYEFVRLGEDANDTEEERSNNADCILSVSREIQLDI